VDLVFPLTGLVAVVHAALFFAAAWGYGAPLARHLPLPAVPRSFVAILLGAGMLGYIAFALGLVGALRPATLGAVLLAGVALLGRAMRRDDVPRLRTWPGALGRGWRALAPPGFARLCAVIALLALAAALLGALLPEIEYDALWYHLTFPMRYLRTGWLLDLPCEHMAPVPQLVELQYAYALILGEARTAKLVHLGFGLLAVAWTWWLTAGLVGRRWAVLAVALVVTAPTVTWEMTTAYNELPLAALATGAAALVLEWRASGRRSLLVAAGALLGLGLAGKHVGYFFLAPLALVVLFSSAPVGGPLATSHRADRPPATRLADAALLCAIAVGVALPWYIRAWHYTGNPLYPMFYDLLARAGLPLRRWNAQAQAGWMSAMNRYGDGRSPLALLLVPWRATWDGVKYAGSLGPAWLLFLPLFPLVRRRLEPGVRFLALLGMAFLLLWVTPFSSFQLRYVVPVVPLLAVVVAAEVRALGVLLAEAGWLRALRALSAGTAAMLALNLPVFFWFHDARVGWVTNTVHIVNTGYLRTALGLFDHRRYLADRLEPYRAVEWANNALPASTHIVSFGEAVHFYARAELLNDFSSCVANGSWAPRGREADAYRALRGAGMTHILWDRTRTDITDSAFAIRSPRFLSRYARPVYRDAAAEIDALVAPTDTTASAVHTGAPSSR
jgi:hypothetical protein